MDQNLIIDRLDILSGFNEEPEYYVEEIDKNMEINIILERHGEAQCIISNSSEKGMCCIEIKEGNCDIGSCIVSIDEIRLALRKLVAK